MSLKSCLTIIAVSVVASAVYLWIALMLDALQPVQPDRPLIMDPQQAAPKTNSARHGEHGMFVLAAMFGIPALMGSLARLVAGPRFSKWGTAGVISGGLFSTITLTSWYFTRPHWWPSDEPFVFVELTVIWTGAAIVGDLVGEKPQRLWRR